MATRVIVPRGKTVTEVVQSIIAGIDREPLSIAVEGSPNIPQIIRSVRIGNPEPSSNGGKYVIYAPGSGIIWNADMARAVSEEYSGGLLEYLNSVPDDSYVSVVRDVIRVEVIDNNLPGSSDHLPPVIVSVSTSTRVPHVVIPTAKRVYIGYSTRPMPVPISLSLAAPVGRLPNQDARVYTWISYMRSLAAYHKADPAPRMVYAVIGTMLYEIRLVSITEAYSDTTMSSFNLSGYVVRQYALQFREEKGNLKLVKTEVVL